MKTNETKFVEEEYYASSEDSGYVEEYAEYVPAETPWWMQKAVPLMMSLGFHGIIAWGLTFCLFTIIKPKVEAAILTKREFKEQEFDNNAKIGMIKTPDIESDIIVDIPILNLKEEVDIAIDIPRGTSLHNLSDKNLDSTSCVDAYGLGAGRAGAYGSRWGKGSLLTNEGGSPGTESAVTAALRWLHFHQNKDDGHWDQDGFSKNCDSKLGPACDNPNGSANQFDVAVTSLALLAFLGHGHTHCVGEFKTTVRKGLDWLQKQQESDGCFSGGRQAESWIYNHALATMAICEAYAVSRDPRLKDPAQRAVDYIRNAQNPGLGWKYDPKSGLNDTSVTGWMVLALKAASTANLNVDKQMFEGAIAWFERATNTSGKTGYMRPGDDGSIIRGVNDNKYDKLPTMTSVGVICRIFCGQSRKNSSITKAVDDILMKNLPEWNKPGNNKVDFYYWYYATYAMFQYGGDKWASWNEAMKKALVGTQRIGGCVAGSWDPIDKWGMVGGRVYSTALNCLTLEIYYRYARQNIGH
ncbi:MAG: hypothetical protein ABIH42_07275 [Planctomycetota bacterium]